jgi:hypothetical protein
MRKAFNRQRRLDCPPVTEVPLNLHCRNETIPLLRALQHVYSRPQVRDPILRAIGRDVNGKSSARRGRPGLSYWEVLVLAAARRGGAYCAAKRFPTARSCSASSRRTRSGTSVARPASRCSSDAWW